MRIYWNCSIAVDPWMAYTIRGSNDNEDEEEIYEDLCYISFTLSTEVFTLFFSLEQGFPKFKIRTPADPGGRGALEKVSAEGRFERVQFCFLLNCPPHRKISNEFPLPAL